MKRKLYLMVQHWFSQICPAAAVELRMTGNYQTKVEEVAKEVLEEDK